LMSLEIIDWEGFLVAGLDLNQRPLGYEFDRGFSVVRPASILQWVGRRRFFVINAASSASLAIC
jgi:hypothetical protein